MIKLDDCTLAPETYKKVRQEAERILNEADAFGVFPTPVDDIMSAAKVHEVKEDVLNEGFLTKIRKGVTGTLRKALSKVLGIFDARDRLVFIDRSLKSVKKAFVKLHETAHGFLMWQRDLYALVEDGENNIDPDIADTFDREANVFASEVLFQCDGFINEANDHDFGIFVPVRISKHYGGSIYASVRQYVSKNHRACAVIILNPPVIDINVGFKAYVRRAPVTSPAFKNVFGELKLPEYFTPDDKIGKMVPINNRRASGKRSLPIIDSNGKEHECICEAFTNTYQVFILIQHIKPITSTTLLVVNG